MAAFCTGKFACGRGMLCKQHLFECRPEYSVAFRADVAHLIEIPPTDENGQNKHYRKNCNERHPASLHDTANQRAKFDELQEYTDDCKFKEQLRDEALPADPRWISKKFPYRGENR